MGKKRSKKIRVEFRKNREAKARRNDLTRKVVGQEVDPESLQQGERVSGKGELTRHRTIVGLTEDASDGVRLAVDESKCLRGRVVAAIGANNCTVQTEDGRHFHCTVRRLLRDLARETRNVVVTGDRVLIEPVSANQGVIERVEPRTGILSRGSQHKQHVIVANVSQVLIVVSAADPPLKPALIDRFIVSAEKGGARPLVCISKLDLVDPIELQPVVGMYSRLGYDVVCTSITTGRGIARLRTLLKDQQTVLSGQSGVGKSSLLNAIQPGLHLKTGEVAAESRKGTHTTRVAQLLELDFGGWVVDTPGIRQLELWDVRPEEVEAYFLEFRPFVAHCKFPDCLHIYEEGCAVKQAVKHDLIAQLRYESYARIVLGDE